MPRPKSLFLGKRKINRKRLSLSPSSVEVDLCKGGFNVAFVAGVGGEGREWGERGSLKGQSRS